MKKVIFIILLNVLLQTQILFAQPDFITTFYPRQHGLNIPADAEIHIGLQGALDPGSISDSSIYIYSDITGLHKWEYALENDGKDLYLQPKHWWGVGEVPFNAGERVTVTLTTRLGYDDGQHFEGFTWHYTVAVRQNYGGNFTPIATFGGPHHWLCFDANGDRYPDVVLEDRSWHKLAIFFNDGKGKMVFNHQSPMSMGILEQLLDFDRNGGIDINMFNNWMQLNSGNGTFTEKQMLPEQSLQDRLYDFNNDGIFDLITETYDYEGNQWQQELFIMRSKNNIAYIDTQRISNLPFVPEFINSGESFDLNNDGTIDFIMRGAPGGANLPHSKGFMTILMKNEEIPAVFQLLKNSFSTHWFYGNDFNSDGWIDYVFSGSFFDSTKHLYTLIYLNDKSGHLNLSNNPIETGDDGAAGDIDGDGDIDIFFTRSLLIDAMPVTYKNSFILALNRGNGQFDLSDLYPLPGTKAGYGWPQLVDLDLDGDLDVLLQGPPAGQMVIANEDYGTSAFDNRRYLKKITLSKIEISTYPNPFNLNTMIEITGQQELPVQGMVGIYDIQGRFIKQWNLPQGKEFHFQLLWNGRDKFKNPVTSGVYFIRAKLGNQLKTKKMVLIR